MKNTLVKLCFVILAIAGISFARADYYTEGTIFGVPTYGPVTGIVVLNDEIPVPRDTWIDIDLSSWVPVGTKAVGLSGIMIITHGSTEQICGVTIAYRSNGSTYEYPYIGQTGAYLPYTGSRSTHATTIALDSNRKFQVKWSEQGTNDYPAGCSFAINLALVYYVR